MQKQVQLQNKFNELRNTSVTNKPGGDFEWMTITQDKARRNPPNFVNLTEGLLSALN